MRKSLLWKPHKMTSWVTEYAEWRKSHLTLDVSDAASIVKWYAPLCILDGAIILVLVLVTNLLKVLDLCRRIIWQLMNNEYKDRSRKQSWLNRRQYPVICLCETRTNATDLSSGGNLNPRPLKMKQTWHPLGRKVRCRNVKGVIGQAGGFVNVQWLGTWSVIVVAGEEGICSTAEHLSAAVFYVRLSSYYNRTSLSYYQPFSKSHG